LKRFANLHPRVDVAVRTGHSEEILAMVLNDEVQVGLVRTLRHPDIYAVPLYEDELVLVCNPQHRFARRGSVELAEVGRERLVMFDRTSSYFELTQSLFLRGGVVAHTVMELDNIEAAKKMVEEGLGVALLPLARFPVYVGLAAAPFVYLGALLVLRAFDDDEKAVFRLGLRRLGLLKVAPGPV